MGCLEKIFAAFIWAINNLSFRQHPSVTHAVDCHPALFRRRVQIVVGDCHAAVAAKVAGERGAAVGVVVNVREKGMPEILGADIQPQFLPYSGNALRLYHLPAISP